MGPKAFIFVVRGTLFLMPALVTTAIMTTAGMQESRANYRSAVTTAGLLEPRPVRVTVPADPVVHTAPFGGLSVAANSRLAELPRNGDPSTGKPFPAAESREAPGVGKQPPPEPVADSPSTKAAAPSACRARLTPDFVVVQPLPDEGTGLLRRRRCCPLGCDSAQGWTSDHARPGCDATLPDGGSRGALGSGGGRGATVLGPGSDAYHGNHIHLDLIERPSGYRVCHL
jgi:hypothetical protein